MVMYMEIWKDIPNYQGYQVSNYGRVRTHNKITHNEQFKKRVWKDRVLKPKISKKDNCSRVDLWNDGKHKTLLVYRLVAIAFLGLPTDEKMTVNHKDGNRLNNHLDNLEWLTRGDNIRHGFENGLYHSQKECTLIGDYETYSFKSMSKAGDFLNHSHGYISKIIKKNKDIATDKNGNKYRIVIN